MKTQGVAMGLDAGSTTTKCVIVSRDGEMIWHHIEPTDPRMALQTQRLIQEIREKWGEIPVVATGYGRHLVELANRKLTEITCHARGVYRSLGHGGTLIDIGGQDSKVIVMTDRGQVKDFVMNDKCAAGTGRFLEVMAHRLNLSLDQLADMAVQAPKGLSISSTCTVFAESEIISLLANGEALEEVVQGLLLSLAYRISAMARSIGIRAPLFLSGGVAKNRGMRHFLSQVLEMDVQLPEHPQLMGAYGAALSALKWAR